jgi:hypothetical protein
MVTRQAGIGVELFVSETEEGSRDDTERGGREPVDLSPLDLVRRGGR